MRCVVYSIRDPATHVDCLQDVANGRALGVHIIKAALANMTLLLLWRRNALSATEEPAGEAVESLAAAHSAFSSQMDAISAVTELVSTTVGDA